MRIAVTGASGRMGRRVVEQLGSETGHEVVAMSRRPFDSESPTITSAIADYDDPAALRAALDGVTVLVFISSDGPAANVILHHQNVVQAAQEAKVDHVVALSSVDADLASPFCYAVTNGRTEQLLRESGLAYSIVRASIYTEFFAGAFLTRAKSTGEIRIPAGDGRIALVSRDDVADALTMCALAGTPGHGAHHITGPEALDGHAIARSVGGVWGRAVEYIDVTPEEFALDMARDGLDAWWAYAFSSMFTSVRDGRWNVVTDELEALTGRPPTPLSAITQRMD